MPMRFPYLQSARVKLQERVNTCRRATYSNASQHIKHLIDFIRSDSVFRVMTVQLDMQSATRFNDVNQLLDAQNARLRLPEDESGCAAYYYRLLQLFADGNDIPGWWEVFSCGSSRIQDEVDTFLEQVLLPFHRLLDEQIDDGDSLLYALSRYQRESAWFMKTDLLKLATDADSRKVEAVLDEHLRAWLFREGIDYPFSKPQSPSGETDIVVWQGEKPLPLEIKVFDNQNRDAAHLRQGLWQAFRYAEDYGSSFGYLVVFNVADVVLRFLSTVRTDNPPCVRVGDKLVFVTTISVAEHSASASKEKPLTIVEIEAPSTDPQ